MELTNCMTGDIKNATMIIWEKNQDIYVFNDFLLFFNVFINIHEYQIMQNRIIFRTALLRI